MGAIMKLLAAVAREQVGRQDAEAEAWRLAALAARDELDRLRADRRQLRARLVECRPWLGLCPVEPRLINEMVLIRDLVDDTLKELGE